MRVRLFAGAVLMAGFVSSMACAERKPDLLPTPKSVALTGGDMALTAQSRIVATDASLLPLARILSTEIALLTRLSLASADGEAKPGDIVLSLNPKLRAGEDILAVQRRDVVKTRDYAHTLEIAATAAVEGWDYRAVCEGTATLLQALQESEGRWSLPKMSVKDWPRADYTAVMIDCCRQDIPLMAVQDAVEAARFWKVRYLHLHMAEDSAFVFPLKFLPGGGASSGVYGGDAPRAWDRDELIRLVAFADARGVTLVPELEGPGHCSALQGIVGSNLGDVSTRMLDVANDNIYPVLEKVIDEMCEVFKSSPYFHVGGDEVQFEWYIDKPEVRENMKKHGMRDPDKGGRDDLLLLYEKRMNEMVKKNGKKAIFWGGWQGPPQVPELNDMIIYSWYAGAREAQKAGFTTITVPWEIKIPLNEWNMYHCNGEWLTNQTDRVLGHCRPMWEMSAEELTRSWIAGMAERQERTWGPDTPMFLEEFRAREKRAVERMGKLVHPVDVKVDCTLLKTEGHYVMANSYTGPMTLTLTADLPAGSRIHYVLDGTRPTAASPLYEKPFTTTRKVRLRAALFNEAGEQLGGYTFSERYSYADHEDNLTTGKPVRTSGAVNPDEPPENANDGYANVSKFWGTTPAPQWWQVDLQKDYTIDRVRIFPYWDGGRHYQYTVSAGTDTNQLTQVVDWTQGTEPETDRGRLHTFKATQARYIRVNVLNNSENPAVHLVEVWAYEAGKEEK